MNSAIKIDPSFITILPQKLLVLILALTSFSIRANAQDIDYFVDPFIHTIRFHPVGKPFGQPVWVLGSEEKLTLSFDDLGDDLRRMRYTIVHCNSVWELSTEVTPFDYINGFNEEIIGDFTYSFNTTMKYIHYSAMFPTDNMIPKLSGNYLLKVYDETPQNLLFACRFMVVEPSPLLISLRATQPDRPDIRDTHQQIALQVNLNGFAINDIGTELRVVIRQNGRWDNALTCTAPRFIRGQELDYRYDDRLVFTGGNQFRNFDFRSLIYQTERIATRTFDTIHRIYLIPDEPKTYKNYHSEQDLNGCYIIKNEDHAKNSDIEADYAWVHFMLPFPAKLTSGGFFVMGELAGWQMTDLNRMVYNSTGRRYELDLLLKQGYYNYQYLLQASPVSPGDETMIEGSHWETENEYHVYIYYRETGGLYERLIGWGTTGN